ncbi:hypothetical protein K1719_027994 [Acacia pycnantha]|nr:hypothetical protein K1719_027994 [Acacia pycnantha]
MDTLLKKISSSALKSFIIKFSGRNRFFFNSSALYQKDFKNIGLQVQSSPEDIITKLGVKDTATTARSVKAGNKVFCFLPLMLLKLQFGVL